MPLFEVFIIMWYYKLFQYLLVNKKLTQKREQHVGSRASKFGEKKKIKET